MAEALINDSQQLSHQMSRRSAYLLNAAGCRLAECAGSRFLVTFWFEIFDKLF